MQSVAVLPVALEKDPAGHGQHTASDDRVAPAMPRSTRPVTNTNSAWLVLGSAREGFAATAMR